MELPLSGPYAIFKRIHLRHQQQLLRVGDSPDSKYPKWLSVFNSFVASCSNNESLLWDFRSSNYEVCLKNKSILEDFRKKVTAFFYVCKQTSTRVKRTHKWRMAMTRYYVLQFQITLLAKALGQAHQNDLLRLVETAQQTLDDGYFIVFLSLLAVDSFKENRELLLSENAEIFRRKLTKINVTHLTPITCLAVVLAKRKWCQCFQKPEEYDTRCEIYKTGEFYERFPRYPFKLSAGAKDLMKAVVPQFNARCVSRNLFNDLEQNRVLKSDDLAEKFLRHLVSLSEEQLTDVSEPFEVLDPSDTILAPIVDLCLDTSDSEEDCIVDVTRTETTIIISSDGEDSPPHSPFTPHNFFADEITHENSHEAVDEQPHEAVDEPPHEAVDEHPDEVVVKVAEPIVEPTVEPVTISTVEPQIYETCHEENVPQPTSICEQNVDVHNELTDEQPENLCVEKSPNDENLFDDERVDTAVCVNDPGIDEIEAEIAAEEARQGGAVSRISDLQLDEDPEFEEFRNAYYTDRSNTSSVPKKKLSSTSVPEKLTFRGFAETEWKTKLELSGFTWESANGAGANCGSHTNKWCHDELTQLICGGVRFLNILKEQRDGIESKMNSTRRGHRADENPRPSSPKHVFKAQLAKGCWCHMKSTLLGLAKKAQQSRLKTHDTAGFDEDDGSISDDDDDDDDDESSENFIPLRGSRICDNFENIPSRPLSFDQFRKRKESVIADVWVKPQHDACSSRHFCRAMKSTKNRHFINLLKQQRQEAIRARFGVKDVIVKLDRLDQISPLFARYEFDDAFPGAQIVKEVRNATRQIVHDSHGENTAENGLDWATDKIEITEVHSVDLEDFHQLNKIKSAMKASPPTSLKTDSRKKRKNVYFNLPEDHKVTDQQLELERCGKIGRVYLERRNTVPNDLSSENSQTMARRRSDRIKEANRCGKTSEFTLNRFTANLSTRRATKRIQRRSSVCPEKIERRKSLCSTSSSDSRKIYDRSSEEPTDVALEESFERFFNKPFDSDSNSTQKYKIYKSKNNDSRLSDVDERVMTLDKPCRYTDQFDESAASVFMINAPPIEELNKIRTLSDQPELNEKVITNSRKPYTQPIHYGLREGPLTEQKDDEMKQTDDEDDKTAIKAGQIDLIVETKPLENKKRRKKPRRYVLGVRYTTKRRRRNRSQNKREIPPAIVGNEQVENNVHLEPANDELPQQPETVDTNKPVNDLNVVHSTVSEKVEAKIPDALAMGSSPAPPESPSSTASQDVDQNKDCDMNVVSSSTVDSPYHAEVNDVGSTSKQYQFRSTPSPIHVSSSNYKVDDVVNEWNNSSDDSARNSPKQIDEIPVDNKPIDMLEVVVVIDEKSDNRKVSTEVARQLSSLSDVQIFPVASKTEPNVKDPTQLKSDVEIFAVKCKSQSEAVEVQLDDAINHVQCTLADYDVQLTPVESKKEIVSDDDVEFVAEITDQGDGKRISNSYDVKLYPIKSKRVEIISVENVSDVASNIDEKSYVEMDDERSSNVKLFHKKKNASCKLKESFNDKEKLRRLRDEEKAKMKSKTIAGDEKKMKTIRDHEKDKESKMSEVDGAVKLKLKTSRDDEKVKLKTFKGDGEKKVDSKTFRSEEQEKVDSKTTSRSEGKEKVDSKTTSRSEEKEKVESKTFKSNEKEKVDSKTTSRSEEKEKVDSNTSRSEVKEKVDSKTTSRSEEKEKVESKTSGNEEKEKVDSKTTSRSEEKEKVDSKTTSRSEEKEKVESKASRSEEKETVESKTSRSKEKEKVDSKTTSRSEEKEKHESKAFKIDEKEKVESKTTSRSEEKEKVDSKAFKIDEKVKVDFKTSRSEGKEKLESKTTSRSEEKEKVDSKTFKIEDKVKVDFKTSRSEGKDKVESKTSKSEEKEKVNSKISGDDERVKIQSKTVDEKPKIESKSSKDDEKLKIKVKTDNEKEKTSKNDIKSPSREHKSKTPSPSKKSHRDDKKQEKDNLTNSSTKHSHDRTKSSKDHKVENHKPDTHSSKQRLFHSTQSPTKLHSSVGSKRKLVEPPHSDAKKKKSDVEDAGVKLQIAHAEPSKQRDKLRSTTKVADDVKFLETKRTGRRETTVKVGKTEAIAFEESKKIDTKAEKQADGKRSGTKETVKNEPKTRKLSETTVKNDLNNSDSKLKSSHQRKDDAKRKSDDVVVKSSSKRKLVQKKISKNSAKEEMTASDKLIEKTINAIEPFDAKLRAGIVNAKIVNHESRACQIPLPNPPKVINDADKRQINDENHDHDVEMLKKVDENLVDEKTVDMEMTNQRPVENEMEKVPLSGDSHTSEIPMDKCLNESNDERQEEKKVDNSETEPSVEVEVEEKLSQDVTKLEHVENEPNVAINTSDADEKTNEPACELIEVEEVPHCAQAADFLSAPLSYCAEITPPIEFTFAGDEYPYPETQEINHSEIITLYAEQPKPIKYQSKPSADDNSGDSDRTYYAPDEVPTAAATLVSMSEDFKEKARDRRGHGNVIVKPVFDTVDKSLIFQRGDGGESTLISNPMITSHPHNASKLTDEERSLGTLVPYQTSDFVDVDGEPQFSDNVDLFRHVIGFDDGFADKGYFFSPDCVTEQTDAMLAPMDDANRLSPRKLLVDKDAVVVEETETIHEPRTSPSTLNTPKRKVTSSRTSDESDASSPGQLVICSPVYNDFDAKTRGKSASPAIVSTPSITVVSTRKPTDKRSRRNSRELVDVEAALPACEIRHNLYGIIGKPQRKAGGNVDTKSSQTASFSVSHLIGKDCGARVVSDAKVNVRPIQDPNTPSTSKMNVVTLPRYSDKHTMVYNLPASNATTVTAAPTPAKRSRTSSTAPKINVTSKINATTKPTPKINSSVKVTNHVKIANPIKVPTKTVTDDANLLPPFSTFNATPQITNFLEPSTPTATSYATTTSQARVPVNVTPKITPKNIATLQYSTSAQSFEHKSPDSLIVGDSTNGVSKRGDRRQSPRKRSLTNHCLQPMDAMNIHGSYNHLNDMSSSGAPSKMPTPHPVHQQMTNFQSMMNGGNGDLSGGHMNHFHNNGLANPIMNPAMAALSRIASNNANNSHMTSYNSRYHANDQPKSFSTNYSSRSDGVYTSGVHSGVHTDAGLITEDFIHRMESTPLARSSTLTQKINFRPSISPEDNRTYAPNGLVNYGPPPTPFSASMSHKVKNYHLPHGVTQQFQRVNAESFNITLRGDATSSMMTSSFGPPNANMQMVNASEVCMASSKFVAVGGNIFEIREQNKYTVHTTALSPHRRGMF